MKRIWLNIFQDYDEGFAAWINMGYLKSALNKIPDIDDSIDLQSFYPEDLKIIRIVEGEQSLTIYMKSQKHSHHCPVCR